MKNYVLIILLMAGFMYSSCEKDNKVAEETPPISNFEEFQAWAGDRLVFSEEYSNDEFDCYLYFLDGADEPTIIAQSKGSTDKNMDDPDPIICDRSLDFADNVFYCQGEGDQCFVWASGIIAVCKWD